ncbi:hypothetical protein SELMODRAFT_405821 [Selaginella moellendorffii]|uniref:Auxin-responsive protein n=1 Tax=Selaginella moellendorffii TaxID=88036 RepID=D8QZT2_SELML|nr:hypothetical protein SELMODRAFT_405821 [Selaginella moellendorffii]
MVRASFRGLEFLSRSRLANSAMGRAAKVLRQLQAGRRIHADLFSSDLLVSTGSVRYMGTITGIGDIDPARWPGSKWRFPKCSWFSFWIAKPQKRGATISSSWGAPGNANDSDRECTLFGFWLKAKTALASTAKDDVHKDLESLARTGTSSSKQDVHQMGRALDLRKFRGYRELLEELQHLFGIDKNLNGSEWQAVYVDNEGDMLLVGDDPWGVFTFQGVLHDGAMHSAAEIQKLTVQARNSSTEEPSSRLSDQQDSSSPRRPTGCLGVGVATLPLCPLIGAPGASLSLPASCLQRAKRSVRGDQKIVLKLSTFEDTRFAIATQKGASDTTNNSNK